MRNGSRRIGFWCTESGAICIGMEIPELVIVVLG